VEVEEFAPENQDRPQKERIFGSSNIFQPSFFSGNSLLNFGTVHSYCSPFDFPVTVHRIA